MHALRINDREDIVEREGQWEREGQRVTSFRVSGVDQRGDDVPPECVLRKRTWAMFAAEVVVIAQELRQERIDLHTENDTPRGVDRVHLMWTRDFEST